MSRFVEQVQHVYKGLRFVMNEFWMRKKKRKED